MSETRVGSPNFDTVDMRSPLWACAASMACTAALTAGCSAAPAEVEPHAGEVSYDADAFVDAAMCAAKKEQPIDGAGMVWVTAAMQDGVIRYKDGSTINCGPGGGLPADDAWNTEGGKNTDAAAWIDKWREYMEKAYPATRFIDLSNEEIRAGALENINAKPGETTILLLNLDGDSEPSQPLWPLSRPVKYEQIFPVVGKNSLVFGVSIHDDGTAPTDIPPWPADESAHGGKLLDKYPDLEATIVLVGTEEPVRRRE